MKKAINKFKSCLQPSVKIIVSCRGKNGENNALAVGYAGNCSYDPPMVMVGIVPERYSYHLIKESGLFVVNLVAEYNKDDFNYLGSHSGRDEDKLANISSKVINGKKVDAPVLVDFPVNIECEVVDSIKTGSHEMFIAKVVYIHGDQELVNSEGEIDYSKIDFLS